MPRYYLGLGRGFGYVNDFGADIVGLSTPAPVSVRVTAPASGNNVRVTAPPSGSTPVIMSSFGVIGQPQQQSNLMMAGAKQSGTVQNPLALATTSAGGGGGAGGAGTGLPVTDNTPLKLASSNTMPLAIGGAALALMLLLRR